AVAADLAEAPEARADGAGRLALGRDDVAVVAAATGGLLRILVPLHAAAAPGDLGAFLPVAEQLAVGRPDDGLHLVALEHLGEAGGRAVVRGRSEEHTSELQSRENLVC